MRRDPAGRSDDILPGARESPQRPFLGGKYHQSLRGEYTHGAVRRMNIEKPFHVTQPIFGDGGPPGLIVSPLILPETLDIAKRERARFF